MGANERIDLDVSLGYAVKETASALRVAMERALEPLGLSVSQYSCLELLAQRPGLSGSELARGTFMTRQSMNVLLRGLEIDGLVARPATVEVGRVLPATLTARGRRLLARASAAVRTVEERMLADLDGLRRRDALETLRTMTAALRG